MSKTRDSASYGTLTNILKKFVKLSEERVTAWVAEGTPLIHMGDNVDIRSMKREEGDGKSSSDLHMYNNCVS